jgi:photosynthetic reaction center cytochrome c subunit
MSWNVLVVSAIVFFFDPDGWIELQLPSRTMSAGAAQDARPQVGMVDTPTVKVLRGLTVPEFEAEMQAMNTALGVSCGFCHVRRDFASEDNAHKITARRMLEMTKQVNAQFFPDHKPADGESRLGRVTCFTCHQGSERPKSFP